MSSLVVKGIDITQLSDDALLQKLIACGFQPGPIVASTRSVYQKKLANLLQSENNVSVAGDSLENNEGFEEMDEEPEDEIEEIENREPTPSPPRFVPTNMAYPSPLASPDRFNYEELRRRPLPRAQTDWEPANVSLTSPFSSAGPSTSAFQPMQTTASRTKSRFSFTARLVFGILMAFFVFMVYQNMEASEENPVPQ